MWLAELLAGLGLAYFVLSPRFRRCVYRFIAWFLGSPTKKPRQVNKKRVKMPDITAKAKPIEQGLNNGNIAVEDEKLEEWFLNNPDLREANTGGKG